jgi:hypothetical protein
MTKQAQWMRLPLELRQRQQWLLATADAKGDLKVPTSVNSSGELIPGSSTARSTWLTFDHAVEQAVKRNLSIGYVLAFDDPFTCIDLDVKNAVNYPQEPDKWTSPEQKDLFSRILYSFDSYAEASQSGQGLHIWCLGKIGTGCKRDGVELYSQERFIACTGDVVLDKPIRDRQEYLTHMSQQMRAATPARASAMIELEPVESDSEVWERAANAVNSDKFLALCRGEWEQAGEYPSQSEADLALMSMFTFYSQSNEQCRRLFRMSMLGKRDKAVKDDRYLNYTLSLIRGRQQREQAVVDKVIESAAPMLEEAARKRELAAAEVARLESGGQYRTDSSVGAESTALAVHVPPATAVAHALPQPPAPSPAAQRGNEINWPPGLAGAIAGFIYRNAPRPVKEVAIVAALGWLAGVCGKAFMIPGSGLNLYIILVARSAVGKEAMHTGLSVLTQCLLDKGFVTASRFIDYSDFASGPALRKAVATNDSFVNVSGEWGRKLRRLSADGVADGPMQSLRTEMTNLYQKSGPQSIVGGMMYSKKEDNVASINGVNYSMIGETTPGTFYDALTESMMEDGFLSRFTVVEYSGERPASNPSQQHAPEEGLLQACGHLCMQASTLLNARSPMLVNRTPESTALMEAFDRECDEQINKTLDESWRQMWNRAHLKALRVASLLAVADNNLAPCISEVHMHWAIDLIKRDIHIMQRKIDDGDVGTGDATRERKLLSMCKEYLTTVPKGYSIPDAMHQQGVVPRKYFQIRAQRMSIFSTAKQGGIRALDDTLRSMCDSGYLMEVDKMKAADSYGFHGRCYRIVNLPGGLLD